MKFLDKGILDVLVPVEINGKEEFIIGSPNISNEQVQEYLDRLNEFYETKMYQLYEKIDEDTDNIIGEFTPKKDEKININIPNINIINRDYIKDLSERAMKDIDDGNLDSAITKSRTILEESFCYVIEIKGEEPSDSGDIGRLYKQVKDLYNMHANKDMDKRINKLLSGLENIVQSIAEMRNNGSDSHGLGSKRVNISDYHARLAINSSTIMAEFILSVSQNSR